MFGIGSTELLVILVVALIVLGPKSLASISRTLGKAMGEFRRVSTDFQRTLNAEVEQEEQEKRKKEAEKAQKAAAEAEAAKAPTADASSDAATPGPSDAVGAADTAAPVSAATPDSETMREAPTSPSVASEQSQADLDEPRPGAVAPPEGSPLAQAVERARAEAEGGSGREAQDPATSHKGDKA
ncbi:Sec-independent protein translocase protein TatB [Desulfovibrio sp. ZJ369]|uniref:Sec-independent protein translocase protein TatB n=1 Tax=Desulfovibrio sp. ZJ369 TaxID=2709793 RepID=UPI0013EC2958|nr:Sec-independent protein translocase protein TatB [Desulfovibrio sp. ZJ369]